MRRLNTLAILFSSAILLAACSSTKLDENAPVVEANSTLPKTGTTDDTRTVSTVDATKTTIDPLNDTKGILAKRSVYFDYDSYIVKEEFKPVIGAHGKFLGANKGRRIVIQGNTDERGGREYNLALGQKRAEAVRKSLSLMGVPDTQMEAVSFGKEKPKAPGSDEAAWAENRRADIVY